MGKILETGQLYEKLKQEIKVEISALGKLSLASLRTSGDYSSKIYALQQKKVAQELGVDYRPISLDKDASLDNFLEVLKRLNQDDHITAIVANKPFPKSVDENLIFSAIDINKDIEGMNPLNLGKLFLGNPVFIPPTVLSVLELIKVAPINLYGKQVTIVGFSKIIGKPLSLLLADKFATVSITHIATFEAGNLQFYVSNADLLISAVGCAQLIKGDWIKKGAIVIDVGLSKMNGKPCGDVEFESALKKASYITAVPGGVGKLTTIFLFKNLVEAAKRR